MTRSGRHPTQKRPHPDEIEVWIDGLDMVHVRDPRDGAVIVRDKVYWAAIALQAIQEPATSSEWTAAMALAVLGEEGWREAERVAAALDVAAALTGLRPITGPPL